MANLAFQRKPLIKFDNLSDTGIDTIGIGSMITYTDENNVARIVEVKDLTNMTSTSTLTDFLADSTLYSISYSSFDILKGGATADRPTNPPLYATYYDTEKTSLLICTDNTDGANVWVRYDGTDPDA